MDTGLIFLGKEILKNTEPPDSSKINCCQEASSDGVLTKMFSLSGAHMFIWNGHLLVRFLQPISLPDLSLHPSFGSSGLMIFDARRLENGRMRPLVKKNPLNRLICQHHIICRVPEP